MAVWHGTRVPSHPLFQYHLIQEQKTDITLTSPVTVDDTVINVSAGHGFTGAAGEVIVIWENNNYLQQLVTDVSTNAITISMPASRSYTTDAAVVRGNKNMNVNGSVTPVTFQMRIQNFSVQIDISKILITMTHAAEGDDGLFGGIEELTNGVYYRRVDGEIENFGNYKKNQDYKDSGAVVSYTAKGPDKIYSTDIAYSFLDIFQHVKRFQSPLGDVMLAYVRDDLTGLTSVTSSVIGAYTVGVI